MNARKVLFSSKLALSLVLGYVAVKAVLPYRYAENILSPTSVKGKDATRATEMTHLPDLSLEDYTQIVKRDPFGTASRTPGSGEGSLMNNSLPGRSVSEELGLALFGTVSGSSSIARAIIKDLKTGVPDVYKMGQTVAGARIESIGINTVILVHNGERKILKLHTASSDGNNNDILAHLSRAVGEKSHAVDSDVQENTGEVGAALKKTVIELAVNGQVEGLRVSDFDHLDIAKKMGLKNNDIIRSVNGQRLTSKQKAFQILKKAKSQDTINIELLRDNEIEMLSFNKK